MELNAGNWSTAIGDKGNEENDNDLEYTPVTKQGKAKKSPQQGDLQSSETLNIT